jgi:hypothetical protein
MNMQVPIPELTILDAINFTAEAWNSVQSSTIASCWSDTGILPLSSLVGIENFLNLPTDDNTEEIQDLIEKLVPGDNMTAKEYITVDLTLKTDEMLDDDDIIALVRGDENVEDDDECQVTESKVTTKEAVDSIDKLAIFLTNTDEQFDVSNSFLIELKRIRRKLNQSIIDSKMQTEISQFF